MLKLMFMVIEALKMIQIFWMLRFVTHLWAGVGVQGTNKGHFLKH